MKNILFVLILILFSFTAISAQTVAFTNVNVIPMDKERVLKNQTVLVKNDVIAEISSKIKIPKDAQIIDASGKYLIPGLVDMHTHLLSDGDDYPDSIAEDELKVMVANGVTTIRFMIGTPEQLVLRAKSAKGDIVAPTIYSASPHLTGREQGNNFVVNTPNEAREAVRKSKAAGYDFIKITTFIKPEVYEAAVDEAAKQKMRVVGHADSRFVGVERALKARQQIEHLDGYLEMLLKDDAPMKGSISDLYIYDPKNWESFDYIDESKIPALAKRTVESNPFVNPTQHFMKNTFGLPRSEESIRAQPDFKFYPKAVQEQWLNFYKRNRFINQVSYEKRARWIEIRNKIIKAIYDAGGKIMTGSDTPEFLFLYGFSMPRELKALRDAGLSNYAVLEAATKNPSMFFGTLDKVGTIEKGRRADLILLNANPLENISATENRAGVMLKGKYYTQEEMNKWLDEIAPRIANSHVEKPAPRQEAAAVVEKLFEVMRAKNADAIRGVFQPNGQLTALDKPRDGKGFSTTRNFTADAFAKMISESKAPGEFIEKMPEKQVTIYGDAAVVTGRYTFHVGDKFSHCGVNAFHLVRTEGVWRIANGTSTLEVAGCDAKAADYSAENKNALAAVDKLFELMTAHKPAEIIQLHTAESQLAAVIYGKDGKNRLENLSREAFSKFFETKRAELSEKMYDTQTRVFGDMATVDGRYIFTVNGKLQHCGMNSFHLVRTAEGWKLGNSVSTIEPQGCTEKEKAMVKN
jgi:cytosine/adenosine deaminase-related metal-dependent hydrolase